MTYSLSDFIILMFFAAIAHPCANTKFMQTQNTSEVMKWSWQHTQITQCQKFQTRFHL